MVEWKLLRTLAWQRALPFLQVVHVKPGNWFLQGPMHKIILSHPYEKLILTANEQHL